MFRLEYDYIVIGSGFGGAVAAWRLTQKGYKVLVLESGRRFASGDFPKSNWNLRRFLFLPRLGLRGIMRLDVFKGLLVLSGAGVGGGSLVYANTLIQPEDEAFTNASWPANVGIDDWQRELAPHYAEAKRMLGVSRAPARFPADKALHETAKVLGYGETFHEVDVGVYFGEPDKMVADPYFDGDGPRRSGCNFCGGCIVGCRYDAKNTLDKNYLHLAEQRGARIGAEQEVTAITPLAAGGYEVKVQKPGIWRRLPRSYTAKSIVIAAGVLGTLRLLFRCRDQLRTLPAISQALGLDVRTNSESLIGVRVPGTSENYAQGLAIASAVNPNPMTKIEAVRYPEGSDLMGLLVIPLLAKKQRLSRFVELCRHVVLSPLKFLKVWWPVGFAKESIILLVMQSLDNRMRFVWRRNLFKGGRRGLEASYEKDRPPLHIAEGNRFAKKLAELTGGEAGGSVGDALGMSFTAHILGGCPMGVDPSVSVIDGLHRVHGHSGLYVVGGAAVPANLGVNPSLTIAAMTERAMSHIPDKAV